MNLHESIMVRGIRTELSAYELMDSMPNRDGVLLLDSNMVMGIDHIRSSVLHAERAFSNGTNRSKTILTEIVLYLAEDRQIANAMERMRAKGRDMVLVSLEHVDIDGLDVEIDDGLICATSEKAMLLGLDLSVDIPFEDQILERVSAVDLMKR